MKVKIKKGDNKFLKGKAKQVILCSASYNRI